MQFVRGREFGEDSEVTPHPPQAVPPLPLESVKAGERNCVRGREGVRNRIARGLPWGGSLLILFDYPEKVRIFRKIAADFECYRGY